MIVLYIILALIISCSVAYFQYYYKVKKLRYTRFLFVLKLLSFFLLLLLLINPKITIETISKEKPILNILVDNSLSIDFFKEKENVRNILSKFKNNTSLNQQFNIQEYNFGSSLQNNDSLTFSDKNTNIYKALDGVNNLNTKKITPIILISDGNQTLGSDYEYYKSKNPIYPVLIGDTIKYVDLKISQINVNKYSFINNKFPVEVILNYEGREKITSQFIIQNKGKTVFRKNISFSQNESSVIIKTNIFSNNEGVQFYKAFLKPLNTEKNKTNNEKTFSVDVINDQTKVLILSSVVHPDIGALKNAIQTNKQNIVHTALIDNFKGKLLDYQLIILLQPNEAFDKILNIIQDKKINFLLISGSNTNWTFLNSKNLGISKNAIDQLENYRAIYNQNYLTFFQEDIGFNSFPPLTDKFGKIIFNKAYQTLIAQNINGIKTQEPLIGTFNDDGQKVGFILGEYIWRWRSNSFLQSNSFLEFDSFVGNLIQYLASNKKRTRLKLSAEPLYDINSKVNITAFYTDENYKFDNRANLEILIKNKNSHKIKKLPFSLKGTSYQISLENLESGDYIYTVTVSGQNISKKGEFKVTDFNIEEQFTNANIKKLMQLANQNKGRLYFKNSTDSLISELLSNDNYYITQKQNIKEKSLLDWKWVLFLIILFLAVEWFVRKYLGKI